MLDVSSPLAQELLENATDAMVADVGGYREESPEGTNGRGRFSVVFNRGTSFDKPGDRYAEMRAIKAAMTTRTKASFATLRNKLRNMERIWGKAWPSGAKARQSSGPDCRSRTSGRTENSE